MHEHALRVLEFDAIRELLAGRCETAFGKERARALEPAFEPEEVWERLAATREAFSLLEGATPPSLGAVHDERAAVVRASKGGTLDGEVLYRIGAALTAMRSMRAFLIPRRDTAPRLADLALSLPESRALEEKLSSSLESDGTLRDEASPELRRLRRTKAAAQQAVLERVQAYLGGRFREYLSDPFFTQREGRYVIPVKAEHRSKIRGLVHDRSATGQTVYIEPEDVVRAGNALREAEAAERAEIVRILGALSSRVGAEAPRILAGFDAAGEIDLALAKARLGADMKAVFPRSSPGHRLFVEGGRHPLLDPATVVPLTLDVGGECAGTLITGPNTGGKTVAIKTVGLFALMAQSGLMLPAREVVLGPFSQVWADIGDEQSLQQSLSTFSGHVKNIAEALRHLQPGALVLLDEIGAGTDPAEGAALAMALLLTFREGGATILASTHYGELKTFAYTTPGFTNAAMEFDVRTLRPTFRLLPGAPGASHALEIAARCGIPRPVVERAKGLMGQSRLDVATMIARLEEAQRQARRAQGEADRLAARLRQVEAEAQQTLAEAEERRRTARAKAAEALEEALRKIRAEAQEIFEELKREGAAGIDKARGRLRDLQEEGRRLVEHFRDREAAPRGASPIEKGSRVRVRGSSAIGTVLEPPKGGKALVQVGAMKVQVAVAELEPVAAEETPSRARPRSKASGSAAGRAMTASTEIHLRQMRAEDAADALERFLDEAVLAGLSSVRIVHGKGTGVLRKVTREILSRSPHVASFRDGEPAEGGQGVTIANLG